jgi:hypothetical protein
MAIKSKYELLEIPNTLKNIEDENIIQIISLSCASNDLNSNLEALGKFPENEGEYFFHNSISIVREIAKLVNELSVSELKNYFSTNTEKSFKKLEGDLIPFHAESLSKSVLKPIRDVNFHYNFPKNSPDTTLSKLISKLKGLDTLDVGVKPKEDNIISIRYTYADRFLNEYINSHLDSDLVTQISTISVEILAFVDSLLADLIESNNN